MSTQEERKKILLGYMLQDARIGKGPKYIPKLLSSVHYDLFFDTVTEDMNEEEKRLIRWCHIWGSLKIVYALQPDKSDLLWKVVIPEFGCDFVVSDKKSRKAVEDSYSKLYMIGKEYLNKGHRLEKYLPISIQNLFGDTSKVLEKS